MMALTEICPPQVDLGILNAFRTPTLAVPPVDHPLAEEINILSTEWLAITRYCFGTRLCFVFFSLYAVCYFKLLILCEPKATDLCSRKPFYFSDFLPCVSLCATIFRRGGFKGYQIHTRLIQHGGGKETKRRKKSINRNASLKLFRCLRFSRRGVL